MAAVDLEAARVHHLWRKPPKPRMTTDRSPRVRPLTGLSSAGVPNSIVGSVLEPPFVLAHHLHAAIANGTLSRQIAALRRPTA